MQAMSLLVAASFFTCLPVVGAIIWSGHRAMSPKRLSVTLDWLEELSPERYQTKIAGIKIHDTRMMRLMEVLLHGGTQLNGWRSADIHQAILGTFGVTASTYTLTQLSCDLRKMKAHGLLERIGRSYCYRLTDKGTKAAL